MSAVAGARMKPFPVPVTISRPEKIANINFVANSAQTLPTNGGIIPSDRYIERLRLDVQFRVTNAAGPNNPASVLAEAPWSFIENIKVTGTHRPTRQNVTLWDVRGADLKEWTRLYAIGQQLTDIIVNGTPAAALSVAASATNDVEFILDLPFAPLGLPASKQLGYLLDAPNYDNLQLSINFSDDNSIFAGQGAPSTFSAFGSATGTPIVAVSGIFAQFGLGGPRGFVPGQVWHQKIVENVSGDIISGATASRIANFPRGHRIRSLLLKTGTKATTVSPGNNAYDTLSDNIFTLMQVFRGTNKPVRIYDSFQIIDAEVMANYGTRPSTGYCLIDFAKKGHLGENLDLQNAISGPTGNVDVFLQAAIAGAANQANMNYCEEVRYFPRMI